MGNTIDGTQAESVRIPHADGSLYSFPPGGDEEALVMLSDILPTGFECGVADADSESVKELVEQGNAFEADAVDGVENAKDPDVSEVTTREVPEDDVPEEYRNAS